MTKSTDPDNSEVFRYGGSGSVLLVALLVYVGLHPLALGGTTARIAGAAIVAVILVAGTIAASRSHLLRGIGLTLAVVSFGSHVFWLVTGDRPVEASGRAELRFRIGTGCRSPGAAACSAAVRASMTCMYQLRAAASIRVRLR